MSGKTPLLVILGPTAAGKTTLAIQVAKAINGEIISADSRQVYRHMDIGTAKPTAAQQGLVPHHLIDVVNPDETLSLAEYQGLAYAAIDAVCRRGRIPMLVGGTGQYVTAVVEGWTIPQVPPNDALRSELEAYAQAHGTEALVERLRMSDAAAAERVDRQNLRRVIRAIEIVETTGRPMDYANRKNPPPYPIRQFGLTMNREDLYKRADARLDEMMREGFLSEVQRLLEMGYDRRLPSMSALGYKQLADHLLGEMTLTAAIEATRKATRDFIRRQYTWFRGHDTGVVWLDMSKLNSDQMIALITASTNTESKSP